MIGGTGQIGHAVATQFLDQGWRVTLSSRGTRPSHGSLVSRGATVAVVDREEPGVLAKVLANGADVVIDMIAYTEAHANQLLEIERDVGAFVVISSSSVYRDDAGRTLDEAGQTGFPDFPEPIIESQSTVDPGPETYSTRKVALERRLLDRASPPVTIVRPCAIHGPYSTHPREFWFVKRMLDGRKVIPLAYRGQSRFHTSAVANIAALIGAAVKNPATRILNIADPTALTVAEIGALIGRHLGYDGTILPIDSRDEKGNAAVGWSPWSVPAPFTLNTDAATAMGYKPVTAYEDSIAKTCDWLLSKNGADWKEKFPILAAYPRELFDYLTEDEFLATGDLREL
ncbi:hypothetical protein ADU59_18765 [Pararhizobium polonicum]|uniref:NAD-dependent epimerase/dehydratase domain-containing protein n=1 Tax=Pararhizobium polonicum TaxID=1612624 RepID=A0A1C7NY96_9HYPH|nr:hypothetical protein ADU59_18765 [Pararhizobium polonicum]